MRNVWETCEFDASIVSGNLQMEKFAVELHSFLRGEADPVYQDPRLFFDNTYLTDQMRRILKGALTRLDASRGMPFIVIDTGFGGGKTHTLLLLHHIFGNRQVGFEYISKYNLAAECGVSAIPAARVIGIDCRDIKNNTLWGEIADRVGLYDRLHKYDKSYSPVTNLNEIKGLFSEPTLLMIDELPHYLLEASHKKVGNTDLSQLTQAFVAKLSSVFATTKNNCLVLTLTAEQELYAKYVKGVKESMKMDDFMAKEIYSNLRDSISRQPSVVTPVEKTQIYDVVRTRLVRSIRDHRSKDQTVGAYLDYYRNQGIHIDTDYEGKMDASYPFHPFLIDVLYSRVRTLPKFNQTRGMLRLLGMVLSNIYRNRLPCDLVGSAHIPLHDPEIADELTSKIGIDLRHAVETDCVEHARAADGRRNVRIVEPLARTILLHSLHNEARKSGIKRGDLRLAVCGPDVDPALVDRALDDDIEQTFWYIHSKGHDEYYFEEAPNVVAIIAEHKRNVDEAAKTKRIKDVLAQMLHGPAFRPILWSEGDLVDSTDLKLFAVRLDKDMPDEQSVREYLTSLVESRPNGDIRNYQNTIVFVYPDHAMIPSLYDRAALVVAVERARRDDRVKATKDFTDEIKRRYSSYAASLERECFAAYCRVAYPDGPTLALDGISRLDTTAETIAEAVEELLLRNRKAVKGISVDGIPTVERPTTIKAVLDSFKTNKSKKIILNQESLLESVKDGIKEKRFGYSIKPGPTEYIGPDSLSWDGYLVPPDMISQSSPEPPVGGGGEDSAYLLSVTANLPLFYKVGCGRSQLRSRIASRN